MGLGDDIKKQGLFSSLMNPPTSDVMKVDLHPISDDADVGFFACMTIDRPDKLNALNADVMASLKGGLFNHATATYALLEEMRA